MRGLFNLTRYANRDTIVGFNPPCGCVAFSTRIGGCRRGRSSTRFNPPCGCVAFSTARNELSPGPCVKFQSALRMRGLFNMQWSGGTITDGTSFNPPCGCVAFSTRMGTVSGPTCHSFNPPCGCVAFSTRGSLREPGVARSFNPPCGCVAFSTRPHRLYGGIPPLFQSALRMRGLFNRMVLWLDSDRYDVSIRLADAWPFQRYLA